MSDNLHIYQIVNERISDYLNKERLSLFSIKLINEFDHDILQILIEDINNELIDLDRLTLISEELNKIVDQIDIPLNNYYLEISTPGIERELRNFEEVAAQLDKYVYIEYMQNEKQKDLYGTIKNVNSLDNSIELEYFDKGKKQKTTINYKDVTFARCAIKF